MKRDIKINRASISSEEIQKGKNFSELTKAYKAQATSTLSKPFYKKGWFSGTVASITLIAIFLVVLNTKNEGETAIKNERNLVVISDTAQNKFINPPTTRIDVKKDNYFFISDVGGVINHHTGSKITIPANAFTKQDGTPIVGEIEIQYREFKDQVDIFFSGIPMQYDSAGIKYNFESAGMIEIYAYQNGEKLKIAPQKELEIAMTSYDDHPKFNLYYLDEEARNWEYRGKEKIVKNQDFTYTPSPLDKTEMMNDNLFKKQELVKKQEQVVEAIKKDIITIENTKPTKPLKAQKNVHNFDIDVNEKEFPEIAEYKGTAFEVIDQVNFDAKIYEIEWEDIVLKQNGSTLSVELTKGKQIKKIDVRPVLEGDDYTRAIKEFSAKFDTYSKKFTSRKEEEKKAKIKLQARVNSYNQQKQNILLRAQVDATNNTVLTRVFSINRMGTWNSDFPQRTGPNGKKILAEYINSNNKQQLQFTSLCLIEKKINATWPIPIFQQGVINFNPENENFLLGITSVGDIAIAIPNDFESAINLKNHTFTMQIFNVETTTIDDIKRLIKA